MAVQRVRSRVQQGGHNIPEMTIRRRYAAGLKNLKERFLPLVDKAVIYDNTTTDKANLHKIAEKNEDGFVVFDQGLWDTIANSSEGET
jgi:predicted ABC-type ATPase